MKLCFPITEDNGLDSRVFSHFGVTPNILVVNTETQELDVVAVHTPEEEGGLNKVISSLKAIAPDGIALAGIGQGALDRLRQQGFKVYRAEETVCATLDNLAQGALQEWPDTTTCTGLDDATLEELSRVTGLDITIDKSC
nr:NifB/NifX family molybdenum-iron cluster-binding protein [uncultured Desulfuromonas sp.]